MKESFRGLRAQARKGRNFGINTKQLRMGRILGFALAAVPIIVCLLLAAKFVSMPAIQAYALSAYRGEQYSQVDERTGWLDTANYFESYLPALTRGTAKLKDGNAQGAEQDLRESLERWQKGSDLNQPPHAECKIRNNLAIAIAENAQGAQDPAQRAQKLREAEEVLAPCQSGGASEQNNEDKESTGQTGEKIQEKREQAEGESGQDGQQDQEQNQEGKNGESTQDPSQGQEQNGENDGSKESEEERKQEELSKRNNQGEDSSEGGKNEETKPW